MNSIIWLVYLANVADRLICTTKNVSIVLLIILPCLHAFGSFLISQRYDEEREYKEIYCGILKRLIPVYILGLVSLGVYTFTPDKDAMYLMGGISAAQTVSQTPEAQKALKVLNLGLDKAIDKLQESNNDK